MAALKLTRGRLVQISVTLVILIIAFSWRTLTYQSPLFINCKADVMCTFKVHSTEFKIEKTATNIHLSANNSGMVIISKNEMEITKRSSTEWIIDTDPAVNTLELEISGPENQASRVKVQM
ncbi:hypothetical protein [Vibrio sp.]|uniref:hypothetical protein n=1 Tax=Vibrio sp. TaxID=678 RepID=UPI003D0E7CAD